jgi:serine/threonine protein kinase
MDNYEILNKIGDGTFGTVYLCKRRTKNGTGCTAGQSQAGSSAQRSTQRSQADNLVAIKKMKKHYYNWNDCMKLREVKALKQLSHKNVIRLMEVIREDDHLYLVFEHMEENLFQLMRRQSGSFLEKTIRNMVQQIVNGLAYIHERGFFHRDIKPENLLCRNGPDTIKIADFGLIREIDSKPPFTDYVSTRWYRAPELLLHSTDYSWSVDIWSVGCITGELYILRPMFPGRSEIDQIYKICQALGTPNASNWQEGERLAPMIQFPNIVPLDLKRLIPGCSTQGLDFIQRMLRWVPAERPRPRELLAHDYLSIADDVSRFLSS